MKFKSLLRFILQLKLFNLFDMTKYIVNNSNKRKTVIFIHGYMKSANDFNITDNNKKILIEQNIRSISNTVLVQLEKDDYKKDIPFVSEKICNKILKMNIDKSNITLVCHSYGAFYAYYLGLLQKSCRILLKYALKSNLFLLFY